VIVSVSVFWLDTSESTYISAGTCEVQSPESAWDHCWVYEGWNGVGWPV